MLTKEERTTLLSQHKSERDKRIADRIKVVLLHDDGWSSEKIAAALFIDDSSVNRHLSRYEEEKSVQLKHKGSEAILTEADSKLLAAHLEAMIYAKVKDISDYVFKNLQKSLSASATYNWLQKNGFTYKKPKLIPAKASAEAQAEFIKKYEIIMNETSLNGDPVLFGDSVHPSQQTRASYGWFKKGKDKQIETNAGRKRMNIMGAVDLSTMNVTYKDFETINGAATIDFFKKLEADYPGVSTIHLILDQAGYHTCLEVKKYLENSRIKVHYLPARSPNLNSIERLWKIMHKYVSNNRSYEKFADFKAEIFNFFDKTIKTIFDELVSSVTDNFRVIGTAK